MPWHRSQASLLAPLLQVQTPPLQVCPELQVMSWHRSQAVLVAPLLQVQTPPLQVCPGLQLTAAHGSTGTQEPDVQTSVPVQSSLLPHCTQVPATQKGVLKPHCPSEIC
jgi:hypothetical protein